MKLITFNSNTSFPYGVYPELSFDEFYGDTTIDTMWSWCKEQWGNPNNLNKDSRWIYTSNNGISVIKFKKEEDYNWFILRWS